MTTTEKIISGLLEGAARMRSEGWEITQPVVPDELEEAAERMTQLQQSLGALAREMGELPEDGKGTVQRDELHRAYGAACDVLKL
jgi:hypothetical protein